MLDRLYRWWGRHNEVEKSNRWIFGLIAVGSTLALIAAFVLSIEKVHLLQDPDAQLSCSLNAVINCASVMKSPQATLLGFPNSFIGLIFEPVFLTIAIGYFAGARYKRWFMLAAFGGSCLALLFSQWLFYQSVYVIGALCPWCLLVTVSSLIIFAAFARYSLRENLFGFSEYIHSRLRAWLKKDYDKLFVAAYIVLLAILVAMQFRTGLFS